MPSPTAPTPNAIWCFRSESEAVHNMLGRDGSFARARSPLHVCDQEYTVTFVEMNNTLNDHVEKAFQSNTPEVQYSPTRKIMLDAINMRLMLFMMVEDELQLVDHWSQSNVSDVPLWSDEENDQMQYLSNHVSDVLNNAKRLGLPYITVLYDSFHLQKMERFNHHSQTKHRIALPAVMSQQEPSVGPVANEGIHKRYFLEKLFQ